MFAPLRFYMASKLSFQNSELLSHPNRLNDVLRRSIYRPMLEATRGRRDSIRSGAFHWGEHERTI